MLGQFFAKSEIAEAWAGRAIWLIQDVLLDYIKQTTAFSPRSFENVEEGNVFMLVYRMVDQGDKYVLSFDHLLRGYSRPKDTEQPNFTGMLGLGFAPPVEELYATLQSGFARRNRRTTNWVDLRW